jgi:hypothetical protein
LSESHLATARLKALTRRFVLVLVLVLERCCLQKRRVNPIRSALPVLRLRSGVKVLKRRFVLVLVTQPDRSLSAVSRREPGGPWRKAITLTKLAISFLQQAADRKMAVW